MRLGCSSKHHLFHSEWRTPGLVRLRWYYSDTKMQLGAPVFETIPEPLYPVVGVGWGVTSLHIKANFNKCLSFSPSRGYPSKQSEYPGFTKKDRSLYCGSEGDLSSLLIVPRLGVQLPAAVYNCRECLRVFKDRCDMSSHETHSHPWMATSLNSKYRRLTAHFQTGPGDFNRRLAAYLTDHVAMRSALDQAITHSYTQQYSNAPRFMQGSKSTLQHSALGQRGKSDGDFKRCKAIQWSKTKSRLGRAKPYAFHRPSISTNKYLKRDKGGIHVGSLADLTTPRSLITINK